MKKRVAGTDDESRAAQETQGSISEIARYRRRNRNILKDITHAACTTVFTTYTISWFVGLGKLWTR